MAIALGAAAAAASCLHRVAVDSSDVDPRSNDARSAGAEAALTAALEGCDVPRLEKRPSGRLEKRPSDRSAASRSSGAEGAALEGCDAPRLEKRPSDRFVRGRDVGGLRPPGEPPGHDAQDSLLRDSLRRDSLFGDSLVGDSLLGDASPKMTDGRHHCLRRAPDGKRFKLSVHLGGLRPLGLAPPAPPPGAVQGRAAHALVLAQLAPLRAARLLRATPPAAPIAPAAPPAAARAAVAPKATAAERAQWLVDAANALAAANAAAAAVEAAADAAADARAVAFAAHARRPARRHRPLPQLPRRWPSSEGPPRPAVATPRILVVPLIPVHDPPRVADEPRIPVARLQLGTPRVAALPLLEDFRHRPRRRRGAARAEPGRPARSRSGRASPLSHRPLRLALLHEQPTSYYTNQW
ncbi:hypothetical protein M885DRAFT_511041 [Pelagophyceae sp. CCMP2097]|nr:hypothetical protein M885DRAFT_511041 [Pelagophyceae sp. CCMP2097]